MIGLLRNVRIKAGQLWQLFTVYIIYNEYTIAAYFRKQGAQIGKDSRILVHSLGDEPYLVKLGDHVTIAGRVVFATHDGGAWVARREVPDLQVFGPIVIEDNCVIGHAAILFPNIHIGANSIIGAGSTVISDIPPNTIAMGVPARPIGSVGKYVKKCFERWEQQKPPDAVIEPGADWWSSRHYAENRRKLRQRLQQLFSSNEQQAKHSSQLEDHEFEA